MLEDFLINLENLQETQRLGKAIGSISKAGDCICLKGDLGAGKTTLTQSIAQGLKVPSQCYVTSPSFAVMHEYSGLIPLYHMDFYRLDNSNDVIELGLEEYFYLDGLTVIEWSDRAVDILPKGKITIHIKAKKDSRRIVSLCTKNNILAKRYEIMLLNLNKSLP